MAIFSGKIETAYYINPEQTDIEIVFWEDGQKFNHIIESDPTHPDYIAMEAEGYDLDTLIDRTAEYKRAHNAIFNQLVNERAKIIAEEMIGTTVLKNEYNKTLEQLENAKTDIVKSEANIAKNEERLDKIGSAEFDAVQRSKNTIFQFIWDADDNKDELFKFKLWALELDFVKSANKSVKSSLRKAKTIVDGLVILKSIK